MLVFFCDPAERDLIETLVLGNRVLEHLSGPELRR